MGRRVPYLDLPLVEDDVVLLQAHRSFGIAPDAAVQPYAPGANQLRRLRLQAMLFR